MAATSSSDSRPLGGGFSQWAAQWRAAGALLMELPVIRALAPAIAVQSTGPGHRTDLWRVRHGIATLAEGATPQAQAVLLPRSAVLERSLTLPNLSPTDLAHAVQLEVASCSPFPHDQTVHGFQAEQAGDTQRVTLALTSRMQCEAALARAGLGAEAEIWLEPGPNDAPGIWRPLLMRGWGEAARQRRVRQGQMRQIGWLLLLLALLGALALTPTAFKRQQAIQAQTTLDSLQRQAAPQLAQRDALNQRTERLETLAAMSRSHLALMPVLDMLTRALPDGAWLNSLRVEGDKLVLGGMADDAAALVRRLAAQPGVSDARLASPATRGTGDAKDRFIIELHANAAQYGAMQAASAATAASGAGEGKP